MDELRFKNMAALFILLLLLSDLAHSAGAGPPASNTTTLDVIILGGQSNMSGRGGVTPGHWDGAVPSEARAPPGSVLRLDERLRWEEAREPLHRGVDYGTLGVGPGLVMGAALARHHEATGAAGAAVVVGLVPCAVGGTGMSRWARGGELYGAMIRRAKAAVAPPVPARRRLRALVWYQGESDARGGPAEARAYKARLTRLLADVRADVGVPDLPVFLVGINLVSRIGGGADLVRRAQMEVSTEVPRVYFVDALGLPLYPDKVHLTTLAQARLGERLAAAYIKQLET